MFDHRHRATTREDFAPLALHWNGTAWSVSPSRTAEHSQPAAGLGKPRPRSRPAQRLI